MLLYFHASALAQDGALSDAFTPVVSPTSEHPSQDFDMQNALAHFEPSMNQDENWPFFKACCHDFSDCLSDEAHLALEAFYDARALTKEDMKKFWTACKNDFLFYSPHEQGKILKQAAKKEEWSFVVMYLAQGEQILDDLLKSALNKNQEVVDMLMSASLEKSSWNNLDAHFDCASDRVKIEVWGTAQREKRWDFCRKHKPPQLPKLSCVKRSADDMSDCDLLESVIPSKKKKES